MKPLRDKTRSSGVSQLVEDRSALEATVASELERQVVELFREHYQMLYRTAYSILDNPADAEDVPQTIFLRLLRSGLPPDLQRNPQGYLFRAAVNLSLNVIRSRKRQRLSDDIESVQTVVESAASKGEDHIRQCIAEAIADLEPQTAQMLLLRYVHDYSDAKIAKLLGVSRGAVAMRLFRARARLKKILRKSLGDRL
jgi:RNA polymerase sigma-70 factor (ECF subfamily)